MEATIFMTNGRGSMPWSSTYMYGTVPRHAIIYLGAWCSENQVQHQARLGVWDHHLSIL
jgi:hypothetical protein